ncbi:MAG: response regulator [Longimicrobiales bacterium]
MSNAQKQQTILIVDDDPDSLNIVRTFLESEGYRIVTARDGKEALALLTDEHPGVVLLDVMMPGMDGWEVARTMKAHPELDDVRIVMLTARSDFEDKQKGLHAGADDYVVKPIKLQELGRTVARNLEARRKPS